MSSFDYAAEVDGLPKVFVVGCAKSGTTWVQLLLNGHPEIAIDGEGGFGWRLLPLLGQALAQFNQHQKQFALGEHTEFSNPEIAALFRFAVCAKLRGYVERSGKAISGIRMVGDKTPQHTTVMADLGGLFPEARFVHVVRDPRDAATSAWHHFNRTGEKPYGDSFAQHAKGFIEGPWQVGVGSALQAEQSLGGRVMHLRYEDLHAQPMESIGALLGFLGVTSDQRAIEQCAAAGRFENLSGGRARGDADDGQFFRKGIVGDWRNHMSEEAAAQACASVEPVMGRFGYGVGAAAV